MLKQISTKVVILFLIIALLDSCVPYRKTVPIDGDKDHPLALDSIFSYQRDLYKLQNYDIVDIQIFSPNQEASAFFNKTFTVASGSTAGAAQLGGVNGGDIFYINGYSVDEKGVVNLPVLGSIQASGRTLNGLRDYLIDTLSYYFEEDDYLYVTVKLAGIRYTVWGEVNAPGTTVKLQNQVNIIEAIAGAGDFGPLANREEVILYRQYPDGTKAHKINLLDQSILSSEFYFIRPNDIIQVKPLKIKTIGLGSTLLQNAATFIGTFGGILGLIVALNR